MRKNSKEFPILMAIKEKRVKKKLSLRVILLSIPKALKFLIMYRIVVSYRSNRYLLGVGLQKVYCQFGFLLSSFFLLDRFIPNFGNLLNLISYSLTGYFRSYRFKFFFMYFFRNPHVQIFQSQGNCMFGAHLFLLCIPN